MIAQTLTHQRVTLGEPIARGGEATVHEVVGARDTLAKIYEKPRAGYDEKLIWMVANPPNINQGHPSIAWPSELLYDNHNHFVGYLMPRISGGAVKLLEVFNPRVRAQVMPKFNWRYLHRAARNLSAALAALHARDYVVGDLNESNIRVMPTALVTLIDTDSFQVRALMQNTTQLYPCPVARLEYTPPELQGHALNEPRKPEHDNFGLAVLIFQLLMNGSMFGSGATEMLGVMVTGEIWLKVPHTIAMQFDGAFAPGVSAKDVMLFLIGRFGMDGGQYQAVEYRGSAIRSLSMQERMKALGGDAQIESTPGKGTKVVAYCSPVGTAPANEGEIVSHVL